MAEAFRFVDGLGLYLTGGVSNRNPDLALGGIRSIIESRGMTAIITDPIPAIRIDAIMPNNGEGTATLSVIAGDLVYTPPGDVAGTPVAIAIGESKIVAGVDESKAIRVTREANFDFEGTSSLELVYNFNGALGMGNIPDADRVAGNTYYRAFMLRAHGPFPVLDIKLWLPPIGGTQAVYAIGIETAVGETIQTIADEFTAPAAVVFTSPTTVGTALSVGNIPAGDNVGLWIRKVFPAAGSVDLQEDIKLSIQFKGG